jgi:hypothetical protein
MKKMSSVIVISDLHLGKPENYLHVNHPSFDKNREAVLNLLGRLGSQDQLIINGDLMELSLTGWDQACLDLKAFFEILAESGPFGSIVYIPGNHDHHYWRMLVEQSNITNIINRGGLPPSNEMYPYCFVDVRFSSNENRDQGEFLLPQLWPESHECPEFIIKYPHHLIAITHKRKPSDVYFFTHGHFLEPLFKPVNFIIEPAHLEELEAFNNVWLEAFDYDMGHAGRMSQRLYMLENIWQEGGFRAQLIIRRLFMEIQKTLMEAMHLPWFKSLIVKWILQIIFKQVPVHILNKKGELFQRPLDEKMKKRIEHYIDKYVINRYQKGKAREYYLPVDKDIPSPFTFMFGHSHKPTKIPETIQVLGQEYRICNSGGWLRSDSDQPNGINAGVQVIDRHGIRWEGLEGLLS